MKRGVLFGLASFFIFATIAGLNYLRTDLVVGVVTAFICMPFSVVAIYAAKSAPPHRSRAQAVIGWLIGFISVDVTLAAVAGIIWMVM